VDTATPNSPDHVSIQDSGDVSGTRRAELKRQILAPAALALAAVIWGGSYIVVKDTLNDVTPAVYLMLRYLIALPVVGLAFQKEIATWWRDARRAMGTGMGRNWLLPPLIPGICLVGAFIFQSYGLQRSPPGLAAFLTSLVFVFVPLIEMAAGERIAWSRLAAPLMLAIVGTILLAGWPAAGLPVGSLLLLAGSVLYSGQIFFTGRLAANTHPAVNFVMQGAVVLLVSMLWSAVTRLSSSHLNLDTWLRIGYVAIVATGGCYLLQFWAQRFVKARYVGLIFTIEPIAATVLGWWFKYESISIVSVLGSAALIGAAGLAAWFSTGDSK
jgi:drug/metabolite transporter (DMT)-like permease